MVRFPEVICRNYSDTDLLIKSFVRERQLYEAEEVCDFVIVAALAIPIYIFLGIYMTDLILKI